MSVLQLKLNTAINTMKQNIDTLVKSNTNCCWVLSVLGVCWFFTSRLNKAGTEGLSDLCKEAFDPSGKLRQPNH